MHGCVKLDSQVGKTIFGNCLKHNRHIVKNPVQAQLEQASTSEKLAELDPPWRGNSNFI
jgi:hypothetical protein